MLNALKNLLRAPEAKASRASQLIAFERRRARWTPRDYAALAREGYLQNAIVLSRREARRRECRRVRLAGRGGAARRATATRSSISLRGRTRARTARALSKASRRIC